MISAAALMEIAFHFLHFDHSIVGAVFAARSLSQADVIIPTSSV
jgi:hypothetical protein